uniref:Syndecan domain-containing protein n=1 Tax=Parastrongyloides trichosuri TaxID=131310 RepID=A0A0N5A593_PARTI
MTLKIIILSLIFVLTSTKDDNHDFTIINSQSPIIHDQDFDISGTINSTEDDFSLPESKESSNSGLMSLEISGEDPFNSTKIDVQKFEDKIVLTTPYPKDEITLSSMNFDERITTADKNLFNEETTMKMVNEGLAVFMSTIPQRDEELLITTISTTTSSEKNKDDNLESMDMSDMEGDKSNEEKRKNISDDIQFDIGDDDQMDRKTNNNKIIIKNKSFDGVVDTTAAEDITIPFTVGDKIFTTEDPLEIKNIRIEENIESTSQSNIDPNSMEVRQSTIFIGPNDIQTTQMPTREKFVEKDEEMGDIFKIDNQAIFPETETPLLSTDDDNGKIAFISTSLKVTSKEEDEITTTSFPNTNNVTVLTSTVILPKILSITSKAEENNTNEFIQEVDFSKTTELPNKNELFGNSTNDKNTGAEVTLFNVIDSTTTEQTTTINMKDVEKVNKNISKEIIEGSVEKNVENININVNKPIEETSTITTVKSGEETLTEKEIETTTENIAIKVIKNLENESEKSKESKGNWDSSFLNNILSRDKKEFTYATIILCIFIFFVVFITTIIIIICKKKKENGMLRFTNSQTSSSISKIEEGMGYPGSYRSGDNNLTNETRMNNEKEVDL